MFSEIYLFQRLTVSVYHFLQSQTWLVQSHGVDSANLLTNSCNTSVLYRTTEKVFLFNGKNVTFMLTPIDTVGNQPCHANRARTHIPTCTTLTRDGRTRFVPILPCPLKHSVGGVQHMYWHGHDTQQDMHVCVWEETERTGVRQAEGPASPGSLKSLCLTQQQISERQQRCLLYCCALTTGACAPPTHTLSHRNTHTHKASTDDKNTHRTLGTSVTCNDGTLSHRNLCLHICARKPERVSATFKHEFHTWSRKRSKYYNLK